MTELLTLACASVVRCGNPGSLKKAVLLLETDTKMAEPNSMTFLVNRTCNGWKISSWT